MGLGRHSGSGTSNAMPGSCSTSRPRRHNGREEPRAAGRHCPTGYIKTQSVQYRTALVWQEGQLLLLLLLLVFLFNKAWVLNLVVLLLCDMDTESKEIKGKVIKLKYRTKPKISDFLFFIGSLISKTSWVPSDFAEWIILWSEQLKYWELLVPQSPVVFDNF